MAHKGLLVVISSPSGGGKSTVIHRILGEGDPRYRYSISATTRAMRPNESHGVDYWFVTPVQFKLMVSEDGLVEYEKVHGHLYGTPVRPLQKWLKEGCIVFFDVDVKGAFSIKARFPRQTLMIFLAPPDLATLEQRLVGRGTEATPEVRTRLSRVPMEMEMGKEFEHTVINRTLDQTVTEVKALIATRLQECESLPR
ncbi:MAG TPA: guanylate kinase [bacterium]|nr:guanylate kinase [bacterium]